MCKGTGEIELPKYHSMLMNEKRATAKDLREKGYSFREIMNIMGYKSPRSIQLLLR